jgi:hypothetical protein
MIDRDGRTRLAEGWPIDRSGPLSVLVRVFANVITFGFAARRAQREFEGSGDISVWPFIRRVDYETALRHPPYLNGSPDRRRVE